jgi:hypothetical protein
MTKNKITKYENLVLTHMRDVSENLSKLVIELQKRAAMHDDSKLESPEKEIYAEYTPELIKTTYGSDSYITLLEKVKPALEHHYANNRHHPEHWPNGISDMDLIDLIEMLADWAASTKKNKNGNIHKSITINTQRFNINPQLAQILTNTVNRYF